MFLSSKNSGWPDRTADFLPSAEGWTQANPRQSGARALTEQRGCGGPAGRSFVLSGFFGYLFHPGKR